MMTSESMPKKQTLLIIEEDDELLKRMNENHIKLAKYLKLITEEQHDDLMKIKDSIKYKDLMDILQDPNPKSKDMKIKRYLIK